MLPLNFPVREQVGLWLVAFAWGSLAVLGFLPSPRLDRGFAKLVTFLVVVSLLLFLSFYPVWGNPALCLFPLLGVLFFLLLFWPAFPAPALRWSLFFLLLCGLPLLDHFSKLLATQTPQAVPPRFFFFSLLLLSLYEGLGIQSMVLGHWYLVKPTMPLGLLKRIVTLLIGLCLLRGLLNGLLFIPFLWKNSSPFQFSDLYTLPRFSALILDTRFLFSFVSVIIISLLSLNCLRWKSTQAATGMLYLVTFFTLTEAFLALYFFQQTGLIF